jgi:hypothetical protein
VLFLVVILLLPRGAIPTIAQLVRDRRARSSGGTDVTPEAAIGGGMAGVAQ